MLNESIGDYSILNGTCVTSLTVNSLVVNGVTVYEVIRVINGVPLFFESHMERLISSAVNIGMDISVLLHEIKLYTCELLKLTCGININLKIVVFGFEDNVLQYAIYFINTSYPSSKSYVEGVSTITFNAIRDNPNAKILNQNLRNKANSMLAQQGAYEALLINEQGLITEGSRSNVFFVKKDTVYTATDSSVLIGITRNFTIDICKNLGIDIIIQNIEVSRLMEFDALFLTGTSPKILPIKSVDAIKYQSSSNNVIKLIIKEYDNMIDKYLKKTG